MGGTVIGSTFGGRLMSQRQALQAHRVDRHAGRDRSRCMPIALIPAQLDIAAIGALMFFAGAGIGPSFPITTVSVQNAVLPWQLGTVTALVNFMRALASALLVALYGAFLFGGAASHGVTLEHAHRFGPRHSVARSSLPLGVYRRHALHDRLVRASLSRWRSARCAPAQRRTMPWRYRRSRALPNARGLSVHRGERNGAPAAEAPINAPDRAALC